MRVQVITNSIYPYQINNNHRIEQNKNVSFVGRIGSLNHGLSKFDREIMAYYSDLYHKMGIVSAQNVTKMATTIKKNTGLDLDTVYKSMDILSQFSSYKSLKKIEQALGKMNSTSFKTLPIDDSQFLTRDICLSDVFNYLSMKNFNSLGTGQSPVALVDSDILNTLKKCNVEPHNYFQTKKAVYIDSFENGYNFLNQACSFENFVSQKLKTAQIYQNKNEKDIFYNLDYVLNGEVLKRCKQYGINPKILRLENAQPVTPEKIADNLNPIMPKFKTFLQISKDIAIGGQLSKRDGEKYVADFLKSMTDVITPRRYSKMLSELNFKIDSYMNEYHRDKNQLFHIIPDPNKSFSLTNYMYRKVNNIDSTFNILLDDDKFGSTMDCLRVMPKGSTIVIMDDYLLSGLSMRREQFPYEALISLKEKFLKDNDINFIFAPVISTRAGKSEMETYIKNIANRSGKDVILTSKLLPYYKENYVYDSFRRYNRFQTSSVLPYMGPDTNAEEFTPLYEKFLCTSHAQKICLDNIGDILNFYV